MTAPILDEVRQFLSVLEAVQADLLDLFSRKRAALIGANSQQLLDLSLEESRTTQRLQTLLGQRNRILERAQREELPAATVSALTAVIGGDDRDTLRSRLQHAEEIAAQLRHESWVHWIISHRCYNHYSEILELIAHCGQRAPTYSERPCTTTLGGAVLDASV